MLKRLMPAIAVCLMSVGCDSSKPPSEPLAPAPTPPPIATPAAPTPSTTPEVQPPRAWSFAFVIDLQPGQGPAEIRSAADGLFRQIVSVEALFPDALSTDDPFGLSRIYRLRANGPVNDDAPWDIAYALRERGGFAKVEPDTDSALVEAHARLATSACLGNDGVPAPSDPSWSLREMKVDRAWALALPPNGKAKGEGVRICHPDTGWTNHVEIDAAQIDSAHSLNLIDGGTDAHDPLGYLGNPGHGTGTSSVLISGGGIGATTGTLPPGIVTGLAPKATLVPIRTMNSVVQVLDSDVARAVRHAVSAQCDVISMSLGGRLFFGLERAIDDAVHRDVVVVAASGNCVGFVVAPAAYDETIAVAGTNAEHKPWLGSSKGRAVDISAPGEDVYVARAEAGVIPGSKAEPGDGTSFATTAIAAAAADWIAFHGCAAIKRAQGSLTRRDLFMQVVRATAWRPTYADPAEKWDDKRFGPGIIDVERLLKQPLGVPRTQLRGPTVDDPIALLSRMFDLDPDMVRAGVNRMLGQPADLDAELQRVGGELLELATRDPDSFRAALQPPATGALAVATATDTLKARASRTLSAQLSAAPVQ